MVTVIPTVMVPFTVTVILTVMAPFLPRTANNPARVLRVTVITMFRVMVTLTVIATGPAPL